MCIITVVDRAPVTDAEWKVRDKQLMAMTSLRWSPSGTLQVVLASSRHTPVPAFGTSAIDLSLVL